jgi:hypothetical protein
MSWLRHRESHPTQKNIRSSTFKINDDYQTQLPPWRAATIEYRMSHSPLFRRAYQTRTPDVNPSLEWENHFPDPHTLLTLFAQIKSRYKNSYLNSILFYNYRKQLWFTMADLLPSLMRHHCTTVASTQVLAHHLPYYQTPVAGTSVHTAIHPMTIARTPVPLLTTSWSITVTRTTVRLLSLPSLKTVTHMTVLLTP